MTKQEKIEFCMRKSEEFNIYHGILWKELSEDYLDCYVEFLNQYKPY